MKGKGRAIRPFSFVHMKFAWFCLTMFILGATVAPGSGQQPPTAAKKTAGTKPLSPSKAKTTVATGKTSAPGLKASTVTSKKRAATTKRYVPRTPNVARQAAPSADRYKEIQHALASKGYLKSEPSGVWDADSVAAMRQFQTDRKLDPSGKLTAASLIDLGLGPKHEQPPSEALPAPQP
jgi:putative peptidoglycan binding protein